MVQKAFRLHVSRLPGESSNDFAWRQADLAKHIKHPSKLVDPKKLLADLLKSQARRIMADVSECAAVQMPAHLARLDFMRELIAFARNHDLIADAEKIASSFNPLNAAYTVGDYEYCLVETRKSHRAPSFLNGRDSDIAEIKQMISTLAGCFARSSVINAVLDEANSADESEVTS